METSQAVEIAKALADGTRTRVLRYVASSKGARLQDVTQAIGGKLSGWRHLQRLVDVELIKRVELGPREVEYEVEVETLADYQAWLNDLVAEGS